jgi:hypothetical protein
MGVRPAPALGDHPAVQVLAASAAYRDDPGVTVEVALLTSHGLLPDMIGQRKRRLLAAPLGGSLAGLPRFPRVDAD